jgi:hypothetical protein
VIWLEDGGFSPEPERVKDLVNERRDDVIGLLRRDPFELVGADANHAAAGTVKTRTPLAHRRWRVSSTNVIIVRYS